MTDLERLGRHVGEVRKLEPSFYDLLNRGLLLMHQLESDRLRRIWRARLTRDAWDALILHELSR